MGLTDKVLDFFGGGAVSTIASTVKSYFPPSMSDAEQAELQLRIEKAEAEKQRELLKLANEADREFNDRMKAMEGTASDLLALPVIGRLIIFARGAQRPTWGFATLYLDYKVFSGAWAITADPQLKTAFIVINLLVLGFLFGERAIKNLMPFITAYLGKAKGAA